MSKAFVSIVILSFVFAFSWASTETKGFSSIFEALANPKRSQVDFDLDPSRKPEKVLQFFEVAPGMDVLDVFAGGGYYTEILS